MNVGSVRSRGAGSAVESKREAGQKRMPSDRNMPWTSKWSVLCFVGILVSTMLLLSAAVTQDEARHHIRPGARTAVLKLGKSMLKPGISALSPMTSSFIARDSARAPQAAQQSEAGISYGAAQANHELEHSLSPEHGDTDVPGPPNGTGNPGSDQSSTAAQEPETAGSLPAQRLNTSDSDQHQHGSTVSEAGALGPQKAQNVTQDTIGSSERVQELEETGEEAHLDNEDTGTDQPAEGWIMSNYTTTEAPFPRSMTDTSIPESSRNHAGTEPMPQTASGSAQRPYSIPRRAQQPESVPQREAGSSLKQPDWIPRRASGTSQQSESMMLQNALSSVHQSEPTPQTEPSSVQQSASTLRRAAGSAQQSIRQDDGLPKNKPKMYELEGDDLLVHHSIAGTAEQADSLPRIGPGSVHLSEPMTPQTSTSSAQYTVPQRKRVPGSVHQHESIPYRAPDTAQQPIGQDHGLPRTKPKNKPNVYELEGGDMLHDTRVIGRRGVGSKPERESVPQRIPRRWAPISALEGSISQLPGSKVDMDMKPDINVQELQQGLEKDVTVPQDDSHGVHGSAGYMPADGSSADIHDMGAQGSAGSDSGANVATEAHHVSFGRPTAQTAAFDAESTDRLPVENKNVIEPELLPRFLSTNDQEPPGLTHDIQRLTSGQRAWLESMKSKTSSKEKSSSSHMYQFLHGTPLWERGDPFIRAAKLLKARRFYITKDYFTPRMLPTTEDNTEESQQHTEGWSVVTPPKMTASSPEQLIKVKPKVDMFIGIFTAASNDPKYASRRIAIRETWMKQLAGLENVAHGFVIGKPKSAAQERAMQQEEAETGVPFLRLDTEDCYKCLPEKTAEFVKAVNDRFDAKWIIKVDDDLYVNPSRLQRALPQWDELGADYVGCLKRGTVLTDWRSKWFEPLAPFIGDEYFMHSHGSIYAVSGAAVRDFLVPNLSLLRRTANEDTSIGLWLLMFNTTFYEDARLCYEHCDRSAISVWDPTGGCTGLCNPSQDMQRMHHNQLCNNKQDFVAREKDTQGPLWMVPIRTFPSHKIFGLMQSYLPHVPALDRPNWNG